MNEESIKQLVSEHTNAPVNLLQASQSNEEPEYWFVSLIDDSEQPLVGGVAYVVNTEGKVFETSGSMPPSARLEAAKSWFASN
ncbi:MAG TPA: hypothetical protein VFN56_01955 [Candidatus Saccharimonadales bacterium]|nr:hypothetical protein [Candidatus Saccharimonadales bacterium]